MENAKSVVVKDLFFLDALRGIAALIVMIGHARWLLWEGYSEGFVKHPQDYSLVGKVFVYVFSVFRYGHQAVMFFFILSGFLIHLKYSRQLAHNPSRKFGLKDYLYKRIKRIYPPFLFALLLTFLLDVWGIGMDYTIYFGKTPNNLLNSNISVNHSLINLVGNLFFLQNENIVIWGTNNPLWSLKYEWWFYLIYPLVFLINRKSVFASLIFVLMVFATASFIQVREGYFFSSVFQYLFLWWLGTFLADIYTKRIKLNFFYLSFFVLILPVMVPDERVKFFCVNGSIVLNSIGFRFTCASILSWL